MNVGQLIQRLSAFPADMPVILAARDEPLGDYEVMTVDRMTMQHETTYDSGGERVWHHADIGLSRCEPPRDVVFLDFEGRSADVVDADVPVAALEAGRQA